MSEKNWIKRLLARFRPRDAFALVGILLGCLVLFAWAATTFLPDAQEQYRREIVNDDYDAQTIQLNAGDTLTQTVDAEGRLYGVRLNLHTNNQVVQGTLRLDVLDEDGKRLTGCDTDMSKLLNDTFHLFLFEDMLDAGQGGRYTLLLQVVESNGPIALHKSEGPAQDYLPLDEDGHPTGQPAHYSLADFELAENGQVQTGTLALQYITRYAGDFIVTVFWFFAVMLTVFLLGLYLLVFVFKAALHRVFAVCASVLGFVFLFLVPPRTAPDEYVHIATAYQYTNQVFGQGNAPYLTVRAGDEMYLANYDFDATDIFAYQDMYENLFSKAPNGTPVQLEARFAQVFPPMYAAPFIGVLLARLLGLGLVPLLLLGRLGNLVLYICLTTFSIKKMPFAKPLLFCIGLLPSCLQLAASFSYDTYVIALAFFFTASVLQLQFAQKAATKGQLAAVGVAAILLAPAKAVYVVLLALILFIPVKVFSSAKVRKIFCGGLLACAVLLWAATNLMATVQTFQNSGGQTAVPIPAAVGPASSSAAAPAAGAQNVQPPEDGVGESGGTSVPAEGQTQYEIYGYFSPGYILKNPLQTVKVLVNSVWTQSAQWLKSLLGGQLGEPIAITLEMNLLFTIGLLLCLIAATIPGRQDPQILPRSQRLGYGGIFGAVFVLLIAICVLWTPTVYTSLFGFQGRYLLPALPVLMLALRSSILQWKKDTQLQAVLFIVPCLVVLGSLDVFSQVIAMPAA